MKFRLFPQPLIRVSSELVFLPLFQDQIPLKGEIGTFDWYLCARISRLLREHRLRGRFGESALLQGAGKFPVDKILVIGLGESWGLVKRAGAVSSLIIDVVSKLRVGRLAMAVPGRGLPHQDFEPLAEAVLKGLADSGSTREFPSEIEIYEADRVNFQYLIYFLEGQARHWGPGITFESWETAAPAEPAS